MKRRVLAVLLILAVAISGLPGVAWADVLKDNLPDVSSPSYVVLDGDTGEILFGKKYDQKVDPANLTQMMTAVLILEKGNLNDKVTVSAMPESINSGNKVYLRKNEELKLSDLLMAIVVYNANDAAYAAANHIGGSVEKFVDMMNEEAKALNMQHTVFKSPFGSGDGQETTAVDMARLAAKAAGMPKYVELAKKPTMDWNGEMFAREGIPNACGFSKVMEQGVGLKFSNEKTEKDTTLHLAASATKGGRTVVSVIFSENNETTLYKNMEDVLNFGMNGTKSMSLVQKEIPYATLTYGQNQKLRVAAEKDYALTVPTGSSAAEVQARTVIDKVLPPIRVGDEVGSIKVYSGDEVIQSIPLKAMDDVKKSPNWLMFVLILIAIVYIGSILYRVYQQIFGRRSKRGGGRPKRTPQMLMPMRRKQAPPEAPKKRRPQSALPRPSGDNRSNPSMGSSSGRRGLEERIQEQRTHYDFDPRDMR